MTYKTILFQKKSKIGYIIFNRPGVYNAVNEEMILQLDEALSQIEKDAELRALILRLSSP
jgi:enoyl-CoA hydratase/carnithine racemase